MGWARLALLVGWLIPAACSSGAIALGRLDTEATDAGADAAVAAVDAGIDAPQPCAPPLPLRHYTFDGVGTEVVDRRGGASGRVLGGAELDGAGRVRLDGVDDYVDLPNGLLAGLGEVTIAVWLRHLGGPAYTRVFDLGTGSLGEDPPVGSSTVGTSYLVATPSTGFVPSALAVLMSEAGAGGEAVAASDTVLDDDFRLVTVTVSGENLSLFHDATLLARIPRPVSLSAIVDHNAWLGRSQYSQDPYLQAEYADVRLFERALRECEVVALFAAGPDP